MGKKSAMNTQRIAYGWIERLPPRYTGPRFTVELSREQITSKVAWCTWKEVVPERKAK